jgi:hypothetical protein
MSNVRSPEHKTRVQTKFDERLLAAIDGYRRGQRDPPSRAEAIRQLCTQALRACPRTSESRFRPARIVTALRDILLSYLFLDEP